MKIAKFSIDHPVIITILLVAVALFGIIAMSSMKQDMFAQVDMPQVMVISIYPGVGPTDVEKEVTNKLEEELSTLSGLTSIESTSADSLSLISISFDWNIDLDEKLPDIREKINNASDDLPDGLEGPPSLFKMSSNALPVISLFVESELERESLTKFVEDQVVPQLVRVSGVSKVDLRGGVTKRLSIDLSLESLESKKISVAKVFEVLNYSNISFPAGQVEYKGRELNVRTYGEFSSIDEIENLVIGYKDGAFIRLKDISSVYLEPVEDDINTRSNNKSVLVLDIQKQLGKDTILIVNEVKTRLSSIENEYKGLVEFKPISDQGYDIKSAISNVSTSAIYGAFLAVIILFIFLRNTRATMIISISIPLSILLTFIAMKANDQSINLMSLGGLTVGIGMIVDSSIVVLENIFKKLKEGMEVKKATYEGTKEVGGAIIASTTTSLAVFVPLLFIQGFAGVVLKDIAYTVVFSLTASMVAAIIVVPYLSAQLMKNDNTEFKNKILNKLSKWVGAFLESLKKFYTFILEVVLRNRIFVILFAIGVLIISFFLFEFLGFEFLSETDMNELQIDIETPSGYSLEQTRKKVDEVEALIRKLVPEVTDTCFYVGVSDNFGINQSPNVCFAKVRLSKKATRNRSVFEIISLLQEEIIQNIPDVNVNVKNGGLGALASIVTGGQGFMIEVYGNNFNDVYMSAEMVQSIMEQDPNLSKVEMSVNYNRQEMITDLSLDYMGNLGITAYEAAITSRILFNGMESGVYRTKEGNYDIFLKSEIADKKITDDILNKIGLVSQNNKYISFASFSDLNTKRAVSTIQHKNKLQSIMVTGYMKENDLRNTSSRITTKLEEVNFPIGTNWDISGSAKEMMSSFKSLLVTLIVAVFLVYVVMVIQFEKFSMPFIVLASIPFTIIGVTLGLLIGGSSLSIVSFLGVIMLSGIVVNNAIVMIDYINLLRNSYDYNLYDAVIKGASSRLEPILMTTLTTVLAVIPMSLGLGEGSGTYAPLGQAVAGGLLTSTLVTLILIPVIYFSFENRGFKKKLKRGDNNEE